MLTLSDPQSRLARHTRSKPDSIVSEAHRKLEGNPLFRGRSQLIRIDEIDGHLVLQGRLPSYYLKQMLQTVLADVDGVERLDNRVSVDWPPTE